MFQRVIVKASAALATLLVLAAPAARAQDNCQSFRAIVPMTFNINTGWSGPVYAVMGAEVLIGKSSGDVPPQTTCDAVSCRDTGARSRMDFGGSGLMNPGDTLTMELQTAQYGLPDGYGAYHAMWKIVGGTGRFAHASGVVFEAGPFVAWMDNKGAPQGSYLGETEGTVCGVAPHKNTAADPSPKPLTSTPAAVLPFYQRQFSPSGRK
jgi:hypothetical protein